MKKQIFGVCTAICLMLMTVFPAFAAAETPPYDDIPIVFTTMVSDSADILTDSEEEELEARAWELTMEYQCAVYIITVPGIGDLEAWEATEFLLDEMEMGYGSDQSCIMLMLSMEYRDYDILAHGYGNTAFTDYGKDKMAERFLDEFAEDDWYGGFTEYLDCCEEYLELAREGTPFDVGSDRSPLMGIAIGIIAPVTIAFLVCSYFKAQMKTARIQEAAQHYIGQQGLILTGQSDRFTHTTRTERYIEPAKSSGGTTVNSSGSSHKSGKF